MLVGIPRCLQLPKQKVPWASKATRSLGLSAMFISISNSKTVKSISAIKHLKTKNSICGDCHEDFNHHKTKPSLLQRSSQQKVHGKRQKGFPLMIIFRFLEIRQHDQDVVVCPPRSQKQRRNACNYQAIITSLCMRHTTNQVVFVKNWCPEHQRRRRQLCWKQK